MRLLMIASYPGSFPYLDELCMYLHREGHNCELLDVYLYNHHTFEGGEKFRPGVAISGGIIARQLSRMPKLGRWLASPFVHAWLRRHRSQYDVVAIQYVAPDLAPFLTHILQTAKSLVSVVWGSDFYRTGSQLRKQQVGIYKKSMFILFGNPYTQKAFNEY